MLNTEREMLLLKRVHLRGFKSVKDLSIDIKPGLNILVGKNGSGKSNFFEFLEGVISNRRGHRANFTFASLDYSSGKKELQISYEKEKLQKHPKYKFGASISNDYLIKVDEDNITLYDSLTFDLERYQIVFKLFQSFVAEIVDLSKTNDWTKQIILDDFKFPEEIIDNLKLFTPIKDLRLNDGVSAYSADENFIVDNLRFDFFVNDTWVPWSYLSNGTKRLFYIVTMITYKKEGLVLIDGPELGIHPHQFHLLMNFLKEQSNDKQIILSTHSPKALDILNPDELDHIMIASFDSQKGTQIHRMTEAQESKAKDYMKDVGFLSDYWLISDLQEW